MSKQQHTNGRTNIVPRFCRATPTFCIFSRARPPAATTAQIDADNTLHYIHFENRIQLITKPRETYPSSHHLAPHTDRRQRAQCDFLRFRCMADPLLQHQATNTLSVGKFFELFQFFLRLAQQIFVHRLVSQFTLCIFQLNRGPVRGNLYVI